ncbi:protein yippee-like at4g27745 [Phtheirospermum japonicum]|uniref:Protein yippee-like n=1 Tax=Phtheirospermum japonicum TaxID=374723 RepID=A0A830CEM0_9LAMI|nr:protein yippee-like at4g27745 [Phtheirospermum japonicum]
MGYTTGHPLYSCKKCRNPVAVHDDLLSKKFVAKSGQAYMFGHAMNIVVGPKEDKQLMTGYFTIANIFCSKCGEGLGWTYVRAFEAREKFKEGRYIVEKAKIVKEY